LGILLKRQCAQSTIGIFGNTWAVKDEYANNNNVLEAVDKLYGIEGEVGYSTHGYKVIEWAVNNKKEYDRLMFFTDGQMYGHNHDVNDINRLWKHYKTMFPKAKLYLFNLAGYREQPLKVDDNDVYLISGWSSEIFSVLKNMEDGKSALENINNIEL
jgi:60 kDa SS-A/Ro ribonucleoprotein